MRMPRLAVAVSLAGAVSLAALPVQAAPLTSLSAAAKPTTQDTGAIQQVRWGGWHGGGFGFGIGALAAGALIGAAISSPYYYGAYPYYAGYPYYGYGYGYPYGYTYTTTYYPAYSYSYYRPYRRHYYAAYRPSWRHSYGMYRVHHHYRHYR
jgi:hypothetical protein